jgi:large subunit ribosomal protein L4
MQLSVYNLSGSAGGSVQLDDTVFNIEPNDHAIYLDVRQYLAHQRQGTHKTKERGEVRGSTKKPYRQKGTGNARQGHKRSPLHRHGGTIFGPRPRKYGFKLNKKVKQLARRSALSYKVKENNLSVLQYPSFSAPKTKDFQDLLRKLKFEDKKLLFVTGKNDSNFYFAGRNLPNVHFVHASMLNTYDIVNVEHVVLIEDAVEYLNNVLTTA